MHKWRTNKKADNGSTHKDEGELDDLEEGEDDVK